MALPKFTIYKHVKLEYGWRYCKAAFHSNRKIKPDVVVVHGFEETHRRGRVLSKPQSDVDSSWGGRQGSRYGAVEAAQLSRIPQAQWHHPHLKRG